MHTSNTVQANKQYDPIWQRLRVDRIWLLFFLICIAINIFNVIIQSRTTKSVLTTFSIFYYAIFFIAMIVAQFMHERYWKRIGQRRHEALQDAQPFLVTSQPEADEHALTLPLTLRLHWNRKALLVIGILGCVPVAVLLLIGIIELLQGNHNSNLFFIITGTIVAIIIGLCIILYFARFRYHPQNIEITHEGIKTYYMAQERFLHWEEARLFASYGAQGVSKSSFFKTFELANEQTVVRWSQQKLINPLLKLENNTGQKGDWNWLIERINAHIATQTQLPLLDFSDRPFRRQTPDPTKQQDVRSWREAGPIPSNAILTSPIMIAQDDPVMNRLQLRGETGLAFAVLGGAGIVALFVGLYGKLWDNQGPTSSFFSPGNANFLLLAGILLLAGTLLILIAIIFSRMYLKRIHMLRQIAVQQPERFQVPMQPVTSPELPRPVHLYIRMRKSVLFLIAFVENVVIWLLVAAFIFHLSSHNLLIIVAGALLVSFVLSLLISPLLGRAFERRIEITPGGIRTLSGNVDSSLRWQDARLFARYRPFSLIRKTSRTQNYELVSEHTVVRWQWPHSRVQLLTLEPQMSQEEFEHWLEQLQHYIAARTKLPLLDLDAPTGAHIH